MASFLKGCCLHHVPLMYIKLIKVVREWQIVKLNLIYHIGRSGHLNLTYNDKLRDGSVMVFISFFAQAHKKK